jgi:DNA-binding NarL/FixJ family response regulator
LPKIDLQNIDLILVDIGVPDLCRIKNLSFLVLSVYEEDDRIFDALCAGASGYLTKNTSPAQFLEGLREAVNGGAPMSPEIAKKMIEFFVNNYQLNSNENKLLTLFAEGHNYKTAAAELGISVNTLSSDVKKIYQKLQALAAISVQ